MGYRYLKHPTGWKTALNLVILFSGRLLKIVTTRFRGENAPNSISAGASPQTPLHEGACSAPLDPLAGFEGAYF